MTLSDNLILCSDLKSKYYILYIIHNIICISIYILPSQDNNYDIDLAVCSYYLNISFCTVDLSNKFFHIFLKCFPFFSGERIIMSNLKKLKSFYKIELLKLYLN